MEEGHHHPCLPLYTGRFLTVPSDFQYQNEKRVAANTSYNLRTFNIWGQTPRVQNIWKVDCLARKFCVVECPKAKKFFWAQRPLVRIFGG